MRQHNKHRQNEFVTLDLNHVLSLISICVQQLRKLNIFNIIMAAFIADKFIMPVSEIRLNILAHKIAYIQDIHSTHVISIHFFVLWTVL